MPLPKLTILDDVYIPLHVVRIGYRVVFDPTAVVWEQAYSNPKLEFQRKVRTLAGNYQLLRLAPWTLTSSNPIRFEFICHKLLRLLVPFALVSLLVSAFYLRAEGYGLFFALQTTFYALAALTHLPAKPALVSRLANISFAFIVLNLAAAAAFFYFITDAEVAWVR